MNDNLLSIIKYASLVVIAITTILLCFLYAQIFKINNFTNQLNSKLYELTLREETLNNYKEDLIKNKDKMIDDYLKKDLNMIKENETLIEY